MFARNGGFGDDENGSGAADRGNYRAAHAGWAVTQNQLEILFFTQFTGFLAHQADQLAGIFLGGFEGGVALERPVTPAYPVITSAFDEVIQNIVAGADVPRLFAPSWIRKDLSAFHAD